VYGEVQCRKGERERERERRREGGEEGGREEEEDGQSRYKVSACTIMIHSTIQITFSFHM